MNSNEFDKNSQAFLGKVRSNFLGTEFHVYDRGENPNNAKKIEEIRSELAVVTYESNILGSRGPRKMKAYLPDMKSNIPT